MLSFASSVVWPRSTGQMMRCVPAGIARPAGREARSPPAQQAPFPASSHPLLQCVPVSPPSLSSRRPHHVLIIQPRGRPGSSASLPSPSPSPQRAAGPGALSPQPPGRGEAAPLLPRAPHAGAGPLPSEQHAQRPGPRGRGVSGGREEEEETWCNADSDGLRRRGCVFWGGTGGDGGGAVAAARCPPPAAPPLPAQCSWCRSRAGSSPANPRPAPQRALPGAGAVAPGRRARPFPQGREGEAGREGAGPGRPHGRPGEKGRKRRKRKGRSSAAIPRKTVGGGERESPQPPTRSPRGDPGGKGQGPRGTPPPPLLPGDSAAPPPRPSPAPQRAQCAPAPAPARAPRAAPGRSSEWTSERASPLPWRGGGGPGGGCTNCATTSGGGGCCLLPARLTECWGCEPAPPAIYAGLYPSAGAGPFSLLPARYVRGDCGGRPCPLGGPAPPPAGPLPQPRGRAPPEGRGQPGPGHCLLSARRWSSLAAGSLPGPRRSPGWNPGARASRLSWCFINFLHSIPAGGAGLRSPREPGAASGRGWWRGDGGNVNKGLFFRWQGAWQRL